MTGHDDAPAGVRIGDRVRVRQQRWTVTNLRPDTGSCLMTLAGIDAANTGQTRRFLAPFDDVELLRPPGLALRIVSGRRWRHACRAIIAADGSADALRTAAPAGIDLLPYQLEPALAFLRGLGTRALLADEVGLGKTIQAALVVAELRARGAADRVLVLTPAGVRDQWSGELTARFGLSASVVDLPELRRRVALLAAGVNPWTTVPVAIASLDYVKRPEVLPMVQACRWDIVIVDEAHGVSPDSDRHAAVEAICGLSPYVLLLTATPHSGDERAFLSLCRLGARERDPLLVFRRRRTDVALGQPRHVHCLRVRASAAEARMHALLTGFSRAVRQDRGNADSDVRLALAVLRKRALSSAGSLRQSVLRRLDHLSLPSSPAVAQLPLHFADSGEVDGDDEAPLCTTVMLDDIAVERKWLRSLAEAAAAATAKETKIGALTRLLRRVRRLSETAIVFTEYRDTLLRIREALVQPAVVLHGGLNRSERRTALDEFVTRKVPLLLATDAAGVGLNLHHTCRIVINLELPWSPVRLEQRLGRVDRIGQTRTVHAFHLIADDAGEGRVLERLRARIEQARANVGAANPLGEADDDEEAGGDAVVGEGTDDRSGRPGGPRGSGGPGGSDGADGSGRAGGRGGSSESGGSGGPGGSGHGAGEEGDTRAWVFVDLAKEAQRECARLARARGVASQGPGSSPMAADRVLTTFSHRTDLRRRLGLGAIVIFGTTIEDTFGRPIASRLTPLVVVTRRRIRYKQLAPLIEYVRREVRVHDTALSSWADHAALQHQLFWLTKLARERAIRQALEASRTAPFQPGLFDRRAQHEERARSETQDQRLADAARRVVAAERALGIAPLITRPLLVLVV